MIHVQCPRCRKRLALPGGSSWSHVKCPYCGHVFVAQVPTPVPTPVPTRVLDVRRLTATVRCQGARERRAL